MKIGILFPRSNAHPEISADFLDGLKTFLKRNELNNEISFCHESIGFGGSEKEVYEKAEKLLVVENIDILIAYIDLKVTAILQPLLYSAGKLVIIVNPGANYPQNWAPQSNVVHLTLHHSFLCWLTGSLAAKQTTTALMASTFYDCGYLHIAAIVNGFTVSEGKITFNYVNNKRYDDTFDITELTDFLTFDKATTNLLCVFDSLPASLLYDQLNAFDSDLLKLFVSPMMLENTALKNLNTGFKFSIDGYIPWSRSIKNQTNDEFANFYLQQTKRTPSIFSLLGWETGLIVKEILVNNKDAIHSADEIINELTTAKIISPRGEMKLDTETNFFITPVYKCSLKQNFATLEIESINEIEQKWKIFTEYSAEGVISGWTNTYLCY